MTTHTSDLVRDRVLCDLIGRLDAVQELLADACKSADADPEMLKHAIYAMYDAGDVMAAAADYLQELREERLRERAARASSICKPRENGHDHPDA